jgi:hypothetical protein
MSWLAICARRVRAATLQPRARTAIRAALRRADRRSQHAAGWQAARRSIVTDASQRRSIVPAALRQQTRASPPPTVARPSDMQETQMARFRHLSVLPLLGMTMAYATAIIGPDTAI